MKCADSPGESMLDQMIRREPCRLTARIQRIIQDQATAEDLAQETLLKALHRLDSLRGDPAEPLLCAWLDRIARNLAYNYVRDRSRRPAQHSLELIGPELLPAPEPDPAAAVVTQDATAHLVELVQSLDRPLRQVFLLREIEGLSTAETAQLLQIKEGLVKWRLHKARKLLQARLSPTRHLDG